MKLASGRIYRCIIRDGKKVRAIQGNSLDEILQLLSVELAGHPELKIL